MLTFSITKNNIPKQIKSIEKQLDKLPKEAYQEFVKLTPVKSGNARRNTKLRSKTEIVADYPYAQRLDEGWSKQAPKGMTKPLEQFLLKRLKQIFSGKK